MSWKRNYSYIAARAAVVAIAGAAIGYQAVAASTWGGTANGAGESQEAQEMQGTDGTQEDGIFTEEGTTQVRMDGQMPEFSVGAVKMTVGEVYAEAGATVAEGDALFKLADESMEEAAAYYADEVEDAEAALEKAELKYEEGVLAAETELKGTQLAAGNAEDVYEASMSDLSLDVEKKKASYDDAAAEIAEYQEELDSGVYYEQARINERQDALNAAEASLAATQEAYSTARTSYDLAQAAVSTDIQAIKQQVGDNASKEDLLALAGQLEADYAALGTAGAALSQSQTEADAAQSTYERANQEMESAVKEYNENVEAANAKIAELTESLEDLEEAYEQAKRDSVSQEAEIQKTYDEAVLKGSYAQTEYEASLATLQDAVDAAQETLDDLLEEQEALAAIEDGIVRADRAGVLAYLAYGVEDVLLADVPLAFYYDTGTIYISVEVAQEQIAGLAVGDTVQVAISGSFGQEEGTISSIASSKTAGGSLSKVTYAVEVSVGNEDGRLSSGASATVTFAAGTASGAEVSAEKEAFSVVSGVSQIMSEVAGNAQEAAVSGTEEAVDGTMAEADGTREEADGTREAVDGTKAEADGTREEADGTGEEADEAREEAASEGERGGTVGSGAEAGGVAE